MLTRMSRLISSGGHVQSRRGSVTSSSKAPAMMSPSAGFRPARVKQLARSPGGSHHEDRYHGSEIPAAEVMATMPMGSRMMVTRVASQTLVLGSTSEGVVKP